VEEEEEGGGGFPSATRSLLSLHVDLLQFCGLSSEEEVVFVMLELSGIE